MVVRDYIRPLPWLKKNIYVFIYVSVSPCHTCAGAWGGEKRPPQSHRQLWAFYVAARETTNHWTIPPHPILKLLFSFWGSSSLGSPDWPWICSDFPAFLVLGLHAFIITPDRYFNLIFLNGICFFRIMEMGNFSAGGGVRGQGLGKYLKMNILTEKACVWLWTTLI